MMRRADTVSKKGLGIEGACRAVGRVSWYTESRAAFVHYERTDLKDTTPDDKSPLPQIHVGEGFAALGR